MEYGRIVTSDEMIVRYKDKYCCIKQYLPNKPEKWAIKVWCLIDVVDKYAWACDVYVGTNTLLLGMPKPKKGDDAQVGPNVVHDLMQI